MPPTVLVTRYGREALDTRSAFYAPQLSAYEAMIGAATTTSVVSRLLFLAKGR